MWIEEVDGIATALGSDVLDSRVLAGGFSHETALITLADGRVVARFGGADPAIEAAVMDAARPYVPVPELILLLQSQEGIRPAMVIEYVEGTPLGEALDEGGLSSAQAYDLGAEVGRVIAGAANVTFERRGFFAGADLSIKPERRWSQQLAEIAEWGMGAAPAARLDPRTRREWIRLCAEHAPALTGIDDESFLVHADANPKNILVSRSGEGWRVDALLDWEFSYSGSPYADAGNMARFGASYPEGFLDGFAAGFAERRPLVENWQYVARVLDMFALSDLVTRPPGHPVADMAADLIRHWVAAGVPRTL